MAQAPQDFVASIPVVTRYWLAALIITGCLTNFGLLSASSLIVDWRRITQKFEIWRLITNFFVLGKFSMNYLFQMFMLYQYSRSLEENPFPSGGGARQGQKGDYVFMLMCVSAVLLLAGFFLGFPVLSFSMLFATIFIYSRRFPDAPARIWFIGPFPSSYLPWVFLAFTVVTGQNPVLDLLGLAAGYVYIVFVEVLPNHNDSYRFLYTPHWVYDLCGEAPPVERAGRWVQPGANQGAGDGAFRGAARRAAD